MTPAFHSASTKTATPKARSWACSRATTRAPRSASSGGIARGAGGVQGDFNWLWGMSALEAREHPDQATVARLSFALDQNSDHDRKATVGFGIERRAFSIEAYLAGGITGARRSDTSVANDLTDNQRRRRHRRLHAGADDDHRNDFRSPSLRHRSRARGEPFFRRHVDAPPRRLRFSGRQRRRALEHVSLGVDTPLGTRGWGLSGARRTRQQAAAAWTAIRAMIASRCFFATNSARTDRSCRRASSKIRPGSRARSRARQARIRAIVESYRTQKTQNVSTTRRPSSTRIISRSRRTTPRASPTARRSTIPVLANDSDPDGDALDDHRP